MIARPRQPAAVLAAVKDKPKRAALKGTVPDLRRGRLLTAPARDSHRKTWPGRRSGSAGPNQGMELKQEIQISQDAFAELDAHNSAAVEPAAKVWCCVPAHGGA